MYIIQVVLTCCTMIGLLPIGAHAQVHEVTEPKKVQAFEDKLFEFGMNVGWPDGRIDERTESAIRAIEEAHELQITGSLTRGLYDYVMRAKYPNYVWGAISASTDGYFAVASRFNSRKKAVRAVHNRCVSNSGRPDKCLTRSTYSEARGRSGWVTMLFCRGRINGELFRQIFAKTAAELAEAHEKAYKHARQVGYRHQQCHVMATVEAQSGSP